ncbi:ABC transporter permease [Caballeronia sp. LZ035]|uniref:ABC transporter permease n=1 Tax=Caballeronia sp. LZ035 TaxID=3038568 RepID=UPI0028622FC3|nr:ABC transporter permease [Caballeronia sp. LZ035]MDR5760625.1 ABC transporter permease [Caballeronia sp. LZ035]
MFTALARREEVAKPLTGVLSVLAFLLAWETAARLELFPQGFVPAPAEVWRAGLHLIRSGELFGNLWSTVCSAALGLAAGSVLGCLLGMAMALWPRFDVLVSPLVRCTYALPKTTLIPLLVLWFGVGGATNVVVVAVTAMLPLIAYTLRGTRDVPQVLIWSARTLGTPPLQIVWRVLLPAALPQVLAGVRVALGLSVLVAVSCEMIVSNQGIGKLMLQYGEQGSYDYLLAGLVAATLAAWLADIALRGISARLLRWHESSATARPRRARRATS